MDPKNCKLRISWDGPNQNRNSVISYRLYKFLTKIVKEAEKAPAWKYEECAGKLLTFTKKGRCCWSLSPSGEFVSSLSRFVAFPHTLVQNRPQDYPQGGSPQTVEA